MLQKARIKSCVSAYTIYGDTQLLVTHSYSVQNLICCLRITQHMKIYYTTYENILHDIWHDVIQHIRHFETTYDTYHTTYNYKLDNTWLEFRYHITKQYTPNDELDNISESGKLDNTCEQIRQHVIVFSTRFVCLLFKMYSDTFPEWIQTVFSVLPPSNAVVTYYKLPSTLTLLSLVPWGTIRLLSIFWGDLTFFYFCFFGAGVVSASYLLMIDIGHINQSCAYQ